MEIGIGRVGVLGLRSPAFEQRGQLGAGRVERDAVREPGDHRVVVGGAAGEVGEVEGERDPELDPEVEEIHPGRQYPHHRPPDPVHRDPGAEDLGVGAEGAPPDPVREDDDRLRAGSVFRVGKDPPPGSGDPQGAKEARGNRSDLAAKRRPAGLYRRRSRVEDPGLGERRAPLAVFEVFRSGDPEPVETHAGELGRDPHQLVRGAVGQGGEQGPVDHGENRRVHSRPRARPPKTRAPRNQGFAAGSGERFASWEEAVSGGVLLRTKPDGSSPGSRARSAGLQTGIARKRETRTDDPGHANLTARSAGLRPASPWSAGLRPASRGSAKPAPTTPPPIARERETRPNNAAPDRAGARNPPQQRRPRRGSANLTAANSRIANREKSRGRLGAPVSDRHRAGARNPHRRPWPRQSHGLERRSPTRTAARSAAKTA